MNDITKEFNSLEEVERTLESTKDFSDNEQVYIFIGALRFIYNENQKLKESEKNTYETSQEMLKEYVEENKHLKEQNEILSSKKPIKDLKRRNDELARRSREHEFREYLLERRLKQRDEVIETCIKSIEDFMTHIDDGFCADMMTFIDILNKCRGDK